MFSETAIAFSQSPPPSHTVLLINEMSRITDENTPQLLVPA